MTYNVKDMVKDKKVTFKLYSNGELWYTTECGFEFPVPINDVGTANMLAEDKALLYMRWIRKHIATVEGYERDRQASLAESDLETDVGC